MDLAPYLDQLRRDLAVAAEAGGEEARVVAERLTAPLESAARLALLDALTAATEEITRDLAPGSVDLRLRGRDPDFVVTPPPTEPRREEDEPAQSSIRTAIANAIEVSMGSRLPATPEPSEEGGTSRITLRLPEHLKPRIEEAAGQAGLSVNAWLVRAVAAALDTDRAQPAHRQGAQLGQRYTGWVQ